LANFRKKQKNTKKNLITQHNHNFLLTEHNFQLNFIYTQINFHGPTLPPTKDCTKSLQENSTKKKKSQKKRRSNNHIINYPQNPSKNGLVR
jgi:hypothetical protein